MWRPSVSVTPSTISSLRICKRAALGSAGKLIDCWNNDEFTGFRYVSNISHQLGNLAADWCCLRTSKRVYNNFYEKKLSNNFYIVPVCKKKNDANRLFHTSSRQRGVEWLALVVQWLHLESRVECLSAECWSLCWRFCSERIKQSIGGVSTKSLAPNEGKTKILNIQVLLKEILIANHIESRKFK